MEDQTFSESEVISEGVSTGNFTEICEWSEEEDKIVKEFLNNNLDMKSLDTSSNDFLDKLVEIAILLNQNHTVSEIRTKVEKYLAKVAHCVITVETPNPIQVEWTEEEELIVKTFSKENPSINGNDNRGKKKREKLFCELSSKLKKKFPDEEIRLKLVDVSKKWRSDDIDAVIEFYKDNPFLWDPSLIEYRNKSRKNSAIEMLSRQINFRKSVQEIATKFDNLKTTFAAASKKGQTGDGAKTSKPWPYYQAMLCLKDGTSQRPSFNNCLSQSSEMDENGTHDSLRIEEDDIDNQENTQWPKATSSQTSTYSQGNKRKHEKSTDELLKKKIMTCLETKQTAADAFAKHVGEVLHSFTPLNQEFVKVQLQNVIALCLQSQENGEAIPTFEKREL